MTVPRSDIRGLAVIHCAPPGSWGSRKGDSGTAAEYIGQPPGALLQLHSRGGTLFREETWGG